MTEYNQCTLSNSPIPEPYVTNIYNYEDPNRSCTWFVYTKKFCYTDIEGQTSFTQKADAMKKCVELGKNKCNAVKASYCRSSHAQGCVIRYTPTYVTGLSEDQPSDPMGPGDSRTWIDDCSRETTTKPVSTTKAQTTTGDKTTITARTNSKAEITTQDKTAQTATTEIVNGAPRIAFEFLTLIVAVFVLG